MTIYLLTSPFLNAQLYWENKKELREKITFLTAKNESLKNEIEQKNTTNKIEITKLNNLYLENKNEIAKLKAENLYANSKLNLTLQKLKDSISNIHFSNDFEFGFIADNKYIVITDSINSNWIKGPPILSEEAEGAYATAITEVNLELLPAKFKNFSNCFFCADKLCCKVFSSNKFRSDDLPEGSPTIPVAPPTKAIGL